MTVWFCVALLVAAEEPMRPGTICPDPEKTAGCAVYNPEDLPFATPQDEIARTEFESDPFYAVILKTVPRCSKVEEDRLEIQKSFPRNKVFTLTVCEDDFEKPISYTNVNQKFGFIAVYAGAIPEEAKKFLQTVDPGRFPGANLRKMRAVLMYP